MNDIDNTLLTVRQCIDPYTPESIDSHTPNIEASSSDEITEIVYVEPKTKLNRDRSVSPTQLKSRLDALINDGYVESSRKHSRSSRMSDGSRKGVWKCLIWECCGLCRRKADDANKSPLR